LIGFLETNTWSLKACFSLLQSSCQYTFNKPLLERFNLELSWWLQFYIKHCLRGPFGFQKIKVVNKDNEYSLVKEIYKAFEMAILNCRTH
jgi:hypothetical protein